MIDILTPSGDRPVQFSLCIDWMRAQTFSGPVHWVIIDDSLYGHYDTPTMPSNWQITHIKIHRDKLPERTSQGLNLHEGLLHVKYDNIVMVEDDDYYHPKWVELCNEHLSHCDIFSRENIIFYNLKNRTFWDKNYKVKNTSLMVQTAMKRKFVEDLKEICLHPENMYEIEHCLWRLATNKFFLPKDGNEYVIGIKGLLLGRSGMTKMHNQILPSHDPEYSYLKKTIGEINANKYINLIAATQ